MKKTDSSPQPQEIELKLSLLGSDPIALKQKLSRTPPLSRRKATQQHLHNVYFDTPEQALRKERIALRIRRIGNHTRPTWLQTLKMAGRDDSALSRRGEWETPVPGPTLALDVLKTTPWSHIDPDGTMFQALKPCFVTDFERTCWTIRQRNGSVVEVALDIGHVTVDGKSAPICELELELLSGQPAALFDIALQLSRRIPVLPANTSKAARGYALAQGSLDMPTRAQPPLLSSRQPVPEAARHVLSEMFCQFTANLDALRNTEDPEVVHQARVGWRRFRSAWRLFRSAIATDAAPSWQDLHPLLMTLGELRDLDVARTETLPPLMEAYVAGNTRRAQAWQDMEKSMEDEAMLLRKTVRYALREPVVGTSLLAITQWLEGLTTSRAPNDAEPVAQPSLRAWSKRRIAHLDEQLQKALKEATDPDSLHRARILAKRMRYGLEALQDLLPRKHTQRQYKHVLRLQTDIGSTRDLMQAGTLAAKLGVDRGLVDFLRGVHVGQCRPD